MTSLQDFVAKIVGNVEQVIVGKRATIELLVVSPLKPVEPPEPLCAVYEPKSASRLLQQLGFGADCPRKALLRSLPKLVVPANPQALGNVNTPDEHKLAMSALRGVSHAS